MHIQITLEITVKTPALIDSGAGGMFIDEQFTHMHNIPLTPLSYQSHTRVQCGWNTE